MDISTQVVVLAVVVLVSTGILHGVIRLGWWLLMQKRARDIVTKGIVERMRFRAAHERFTHPPLSRVS